MKELSEFHKRADAKDGHVGICRDCYSLYHKEYYQKNGDKKRDKDREYARKNREARRIACRAYHEANKERLNEVSRQYAKTHRESINAAYNKKIANNPEFRLNHYIRSAIRVSLHGDKNGRHWEDLVGYSLTDLRVHIERQFVDGMTWDNYGEWHIDHIIPLSIFNISGIKSKGFKKAWALENLRPLWGIDNYRKNNKLFAA